MAEISMFTSYKKEEDIVTKVCAFALKSIYEYNVKVFENYIRSIIDLSDVDNLIPSFSVQKTFKAKNSRKSSTADIFISQMGFNFCIEGKRLETFTKKQIERYVNNLKDISGLNVVILLANEITRKTQNLINKINCFNVRIIPITYANIVDGFYDLGEIPTYLKNILDETESYLEKQNLLNDWESRLDIVNCAKSCKDIIQKDEDYSFYICPDKGGAFAHKRCRYFGIYEQKAVSDIFEIEDVVIYNQNGTLSDGVYGKIKKSKIKSFVEKHLKACPHYKEETILHSLQIFCLKKHHSLEAPFVKTSKGGMYGSKIYFTFEKDECKDIETLAKTISGKTWEEFRK